MDNFDNDTPIMFDLNAEEEELIKQVYYRWQDIEKIMGVRINGIAGLFQNKLQGISINEIRAWNVSTVEHIQGYMDRYENSMETIQKLLDVTMKVVSKWIPKEGE